MYCVKDIETSFERFASRKGNQPSPIKGLQVSPIKGLQASPEKGLQTSPAKGLQTSPNKPDLFIIKIDDTGVGNVLGFENQEVEGGYKRCPVCSKMCNSEGVFDYHQAGIYTFPFTTPPPGLEKARYHGSRYAEVFGTHRDFLISQGIFCKMFRVSRFAGYFFFTHRGF